MCTAESSSTHTRFYSRERTRTVCLGRGQWGNQFSTMPWSNLSSFDQDFSFSPSLPKRTSARPSQFRDRGATDGVMAVTLETGGTLRSKSNPVGSGF